LDIPGALHHIMVRGIKKPIYLMTIRTRHSFLSDTRVVIALRGRDELGLSAAEIARRQVGVNTSGITKAIERAEQRYVYNKNKKESQVKI
jgi:hypothetical protein